MFIWFSFLLKLLVFQEHFCRNKTNHRLWTCSIFYTDKKECMIVGVLISWVSSWGWDDGRCPGATQTYLSCDWSCCCMTQWHSFWLWRCSLDAFCFGFLKLKIHLNRGESPLLITAVCLGTESSFSSYQRGMLLHSCLSCSSVVGLRCWISLFHDASNVFSQRSELQAGQCSTSVKPLSMCFSFVLLNYARPSTKKTSSQEHVVLIFVITFSAFPDI